MRRQPLFYLAESNTQYLCVNAEGEVIGKALWRSLESRIEILLLLLLEI